MANVTSLDVHGNHDGLVARLRKAVADYKLYRRTLAELQGMTSRELRDLGISSYSIRQVAFESVYGA